MSDKWISHYGESNSSSTGQMICLRHIFKIRTYRKDSDTRASYVVVFEPDVLGNSGNVQWQYNSLVDAEDVILRIVAIIEGITFEELNYERIKSSRLYVDLIRGFISPPSKGKQTK